MRTAGESEQSLEISRLWTMDPGVVTQTETYSQDVNRLSSLANLFKDRAKKSLDRHFLFSCSINKILSAFESLKRFKK